MSMLPIYEQKKYLSPIQCRMKRFSAPHLFNKNSPSTHTYTYEYYTYEYYNCEKTDSLWHVEFNHIPKKAAKQ